MPDLETLKKRLAEDTDPALQKYFQDEIDKLQPKKGSKSKTAPAPENEDTGWFEVEATEQDYEEARSGFPVVGEWPAEFGLPYLYEKTGASYCFPFHIPAERYRAPFEAEGLMWAPLSKSGVWKLKEILEQLGVKHSVNPQTGNIRFKPSDVAGKVAKVQYILEPGATYTDADGNIKASTIPQAKRVIAITAEKKSLGIGK